MISHSINLASFAGGMTTLQAFLVSLSPNLKLSSLLPLKFTRWSIGNSEVALVEASGSGPASAGRENDEVKGRRFSICVPGGASGKR
jgi:hypothetical protein